MTLEKYVLSSRLVSLFIQYLSYIISSVIIITGDPKNRMKMRNIRSTGTRSVNGKEKQVDIVTL